MSVGFVPTLGRREPVAPGRHAACLLKATGTEPVLGPHVAIIPDGNGRWAERRGLRRGDGHAEGARTLKKIIDHATHSQVSRLTVFLCSTENMNRSTAEVNLLMTMMRDEVRAYRANPALSVSWIGEADRLPLDLQHELADVDRCQSDGDAAGGHSGKLAVTFAINYGGRREIASVAQRLAVDVKAERLSTETITEAVIDQYIRELSVPDPDLIIRTGGEIRLSNFLLWQSAYSELYFTDVLWPDFSGHHLNQALQWFADRKRKFGVVR